MPKANEAPYGQDATKDRLLFSVIREDPRIEDDLVRRTRAKRVLTVASGGCVALSLASRFPDVAVTAFDKSAAQLDHILKKISVLSGKNNSELFNVEDANADFLNQCGEFERVFRLLRKFFEEFIAPHHELLQFFTRSRRLEDLDAMVRRWTSSGYWSAAFHACFSDELLRTTLGPRVLRHATNGSYAEFFQRSFNHGFRRDSAPENPFLQHVFLGGYRRGCEPLYIKHRGPIRLGLVHGSLDVVENLPSFDVVSLSNVFDGMEDEEVTQWAAMLGDLKPGTALLFRQMNASRHIRRFFEEDFAFDSQLGKSYFYRDRSFLYGRFNVAFRKPRPTAAVAVPLLAAAADAPGPENALAANEAPALVSAAEVESSSKKAE